MKLRIVSICLIFPALLVAQVSKYPSFIAGTESGGVFSIPNADSPIDFPRYWALRFAPHASFRVYKRFYAGLQFEYSFGEFEYERLPSTKGAGVTLKYLFHNNNSNRFLRNRFIPYTELSWNFLNYTIDYSKNYGVEPLGKFSNHNIQGLLGLNFRLFDRLYLDYAIRLMFYSQNEKFKLTNRVGLQYHFGEKREFRASTVQTTTDKTIDKKRLGWFDFRYFLKNRLLTLRYAYVFSEFNTNDIFEFQQSSVPIAFTISLSSDLYLGLMYQPMWISVRNKGSDFVYMVGPLLQYDLIRKPTERRFFIELGYFRGNLCACGEDVPFKKGNLSYFPTGIGYEQRIKHTKLYWSLSAHRYNILTNLPFYKGSFVHPTVGIVYRAADDNTLLR
jgi:hypothetical protein